jgi:hypothetical protein
MVYIELSPKLMFIPLHMTAFLRKLEQLAPGLDFRPYTSYLRLSSYKV